MRRSTEKLGTMTRGRAIGRILPTGLVLSALVSCSSPTSPGDGQGTYVFDYSALPAQIASLDLGTTGAYADAVDLGGNHLVIARGKELTVVDVADPANPQIVEHVTLEGYVVGVAALPEKVLILDQSGLRSLDLQSLSTPSIPCLTFAQGEQPVLMRVLDRCFLATRAGVLHYLYILDMEDPSKPRIMSKVVIGAEITDIAQEQNLVIVGTESGAVFLDVSNAEQVEMLSTIGKGQYVALANGFAYVNGTERGSSGVTALDLQDPRHPIEIGSSLAPRWQGRMLIRGSRLFVSAQEQIEVIDVVDRRHLQPEGSIYTGGRKGSFFRDEFVWSIGEKLTVHRIGKTMAVPLVGESSILIWSQVQLQSGRLYAVGAKGFFSMSVQDPKLASPQVYLPGSYSGNRVVDDDRVYVHSWYDMGLVVKIYSLVRGDLLGEVDLTPHAVRKDDRIVVAHAKGDHLYVVVSDQINTRYQVLVIDVGHAGTPQVVGQVLREGEPRLYVRGSLLFQDQRLAVVSDGTGPGGAVDIIDLSAPHQPNLISHTTILDPAGKITFDKGFLYLDTYEGILVLDAREPTQPRQVALFGERGHQYTDLVVKNGILYAMLRERMEIVDVRYPQRPRLIARRGHLSTNHAERLFAGDEVLYAVMNYGLQVLPLHASID